MKKVLILAIISLFVFSDIFSQSRLRLDLRSRIGGLGLIERLNESDDAFRRVSNRPKSLGGKPFWKWRYMNILVGPELDFVFPNSSLGLIGGVKLLNRSYYLPPTQKYNTSDQFITMSSTGIVPMVGLTYKTGNVQSEARTFISVIARYDHFFKYREREEIEGYFKKSPIISTDIDRIKNNGFTVMAGLGFTSDNGYSLSLEIERPIYSFFNKDYINPLGLQPFKDYNTSVALMFLVYTQRIK